MKLKVKDLKGEEFSVIADPSDCVNQLLSSFWTLRIGSKSKKGWPSIHKS